MTGFGLANPKLFGEREQTRQVLTRQPANRPAPGTAVVTDKGLSGQDTEQFFTDLDLTLIRPARRDEKTPGPFPNWLRQRVEAIIWTLKDQLGLEDHGGRVPLGLWTRGRSCGARRHVAGDLGTTRWCAAFRQVERFGRKRAAGAGGGCGD